MALDDGELQSGEWPFQRARPLSNHYNVDKLNGEVLSVQQSPFYEEKFMTITDFSFQIWEDDRINPIFSAPISFVFYTSGCWSYSRPGVVYIGKVDGVLEVWSIHEQSYHAIKTYQLASVPIVCINTFCWAADSASDNPDDSLELGNNSATIPTRNCGENIKWNRKEEFEEFLAVGDCSGSIHIHKLPLYLKTMAQNEVKLVASFFEKEGHKIQQWNDRQIAIQNAAAAGLTTHESNDEKEYEQDLSQHGVAVEEEYQALEKRYLEELRLHN
ncbi:WD domain, G-beta repeat-containing protein [Cardiosporidium cionae]|uniref:WD domain, G-beta repeat-containing protein n=1 Tax=Cardiosporidium cionae TaxID=476202 RepID=A0ABQ7JE81_9APIC|nr:WD domain, G-beta repeat-containing protein [Cardiosporidium cionae]|eukprot:KAF8822309.1 WD domain, G-beta repeat-containing protein [Cardiosporidium cionae]